MSRGRQALITIALALAVILVIAGASLAQHLVQEREGSAFYTAPDPLPPGDPGELIAIEPLLIAPPGAHAWRVMYHSRDLHGADVAVSGTVVAPAGTPPEGGRPIVAWGHPTTGAVARCAPSIGIAPLDLIEGLGPLLEAGYVVAATDYPGMGVAGPSSYLLGVTEGDSVLDAARAARAIDETGAGDDLLLWGHSQGGQAALFAAQLAPTYAPELHLRAVAVAAPAADLGRLLSADIDDISGVSIGAYAFAAFEAAYATDYPGLSLDSILTPQAAAATPRMAGLCTFGQNGELHDLAGPLVGDYLAHDPSTTEPWATMLRENSAGGSRIAVPVMVAQGSADTLVEPHATDAFVKAACAAGDDIDYRVFDGATHATIADLATGRVVEFFAAAERGDLRPGTCGTAW